MTWKVIPGFGRYQINKKGEVRRVPGITWRGPPVTAVKPKIGRYSNTGDRRRLYYLRDDAGKRYLFSAAHLLLRTFVRLPRPGEWALHKDDDETDDSLKNLYWGTRQDNVRDRGRNRGHGRRAWTDEQREAQRQINLSKPGHGISDKVRQAAIEAHTGSHHTRITRHKMSRSHTGLKQSDAHSLAIAEGQRRAWARRKAEAEASGRPPFDEKWIKNLGRGQRRRQRREREEAKQHIGRERRITD